MSKDGAHLCDTRLRYPIHVDTMEMRPGCTKVHTIHASKMVGEQGRKRSIDLNGSPRWDVGYVAHRGTSRIRNAHVMLATWRIKARHEPQLDDHSPLIHHRQHPGVHRGGFTTFGARGG